jgi:hypothetical protein
MSKLREAAQAVIDARDNYGYSPSLQAAMNALREALAEPEPEPEYEPWGIIMGSPGGRWVTSQVETSKIWPDGTALYVRVGEKK